MVKIKCITVNVRPCCQNFSQKVVWVIKSFYIYDIMYGNDITPCIKVDKPLIVYRLVTLCKHPKESCIDALFDLSTFLSHVGKGLPQ